MLFFFVTQKQTRQEKTANKQGKDKKRNKKTRKGQKNKKQEKERHRVKKEKWKKPRRKKGRHWEINQNNPFSGENSVFVKRHKHKILRRVEGQQPQNTTCKVFFVFCPFGLLMFTYRLRIPCSLQKCHSSFLLFFFSVDVFLSFVSIFVFYCALCYWFSCFHSCIFSLCDQKNQIKSQNISNVHFDVLL